MPLGSRDPQRLGAAGDRWGAAAVSGPRETVEKETVEISSLYRLRRDGRWWNLSVSVQDH
ncbi:MAG: hypothetical protein AT709_04795 [Caldivirga sp. MG_3]|nr:MAG: hypothetical protein AT709_04795 [Caldivirga sp. MG_3]